MGLRNSSTAILAGIILCCGAPSAVAQELARSVRLEVDNDFFDFSRPPRQRPDDNYTQGLRIAWDIHRVPGFARGLVCAEAHACGATLEFGQEMYTSFFFNAPPIPGDRPFAGWLYGKATIDGATDHGLKSVSLTVGMTGPPSLAGAAQREFHHLIPDFYDPIGWEYQLPTEPGFSLAGARSWRLSPTGKTGRYMDAVVSIRGAAGTLRMSAGTGVRVRAGLPLTHPWLASALPRLAPYGFVGVAGEAVVWDLFLDGTAFRDSFHTSHRDFIAEWEEGVGLRVRHFGLEYRAVTRSRELPGGPRTHTYGSFRLSWSVR